jgi:hypothetical protein
VSQALMDYVTARRAAILAVLEMLHAEHQPSDELSSVIDVTDAGCEVDVVAVRLADATDALERGRKPAGWDKPAVAAVLQSARARVVQAALRCLSAEYADESADAASEAEYASDQLSLAARDLAVIVRTREGRQP